MSLAIPNQGRMLPPTLDTRDPEAQRGTRAVRRLVPDWIVGRDLTAKRYTLQLWGPSVSAGGWVPLLVIQNDEGQPLQPPIRWERVVHALRQGMDEGEKLVDRIMEHNEMLNRRQESDRRAVETEKTAYVADAIAAESSGASRFSTHDVMLGLKNADEGRSKDEPQGQVVFAPGVQPETGG